MINIRTWGNVLRLAAIVLFLAGCGRAGDTQTAQRVIIIGVDGMGAEMFQLAHTPLMKTLAREGAISIKARNVLPTVSMPCWGSILTGAGPEQHGITSNDWLVNRYEIAPTAHDEDGYFPSIFTVLRKKLPGAELAAFYDWDGFGELFNHKDLSRTELTKGFEETFQEAIPYILEKKPQLAFLYIGHPDEVGHEFGWDSEEFYQSLQAVDGKVGELVQALKKAGLYDGTYFIIVADHGGIGYEHGGESMPEIEVPWIIKGPGVIQGRAISQPINIYDTAATVAYLFQCSAPYEWLGRPVLGAFESNRDLAAVNADRFVPMPKGSVRSGLYNEPKELAFSVDEEAAQIRYSVDGGEPSRNSPLYRRPILLNETTVIKAAAFKGAARSSISATNFERVFRIKGVTLSEAPDDQYWAQGPLSLVDGKRGGPDYKNPAWMGFERTDLEAVIEFEVPRSLHKLALECYEDADSWISPPEQVEFAVSEDGVTFKCVAVVDSETIKKVDDTPVRQIEIDIPAHLAKFLRVRASRACDRWLFVDEVIFE
jgi:hypothetical protein